MVSRPLPSSFPYLSTSQQHPLPQSHRSTTANNAAAASRPNARAGPSNYRQQSFGTERQLARNTQPRTNSNLNPNAPARGRPAAKPLLGLVVDIPIGRRRKKKPGEVPPPSLPEGYVPRVKVIPKEEDFSTLQNDLMCRWYKCDAKLANIEIARKHYIRHQSKVVGTICGIRRCPHSLADALPETLGRHFTDHHAHDHNPNPNFLSKKDIALGSKPRPPPARFLAPPPPLPEAGIPPYHLITHEVTPSFLHPKPSQPASQPSTSSSPAMLPLQIRKLQARAASVASDPTSPKGPHPLRPDFGDAPFHPLQGDAIAESTRYSSFIFPHPAQFINNTAEKDIAQECADTLSIPNPEAKSSLPIFTFPILPPPSHESRSNSASSSRTAVSLAMDPSSSFQDPSKTARTTIPFQIVPLEQAGRVPMTVPLADVVADAKRRKTLASTGYPKPPAPIVNDKRRKATRPEAYRPERIRAIAKKVASRETGRTMGVDWWETMYEVERALNDAVMEVDDEG